MTNQSVREQLEAKKAEVEKRLSGASRDLEKQYSQDFAEQATERENDDVLRSIRIEAEAELRQIKLALKQIEADQYGICDVCGDEINPKRLEIMPYATRCANCAE